MGRENSTFNLEDIGNGSTLTTNVNQDCIVTTYDKVKLSLIEYENNKKFASNWWNYLCMALSFLIPCFTADFKDFWFLPAETIKSFFIVLSVLLGALTLYGGIKRIRYRKKITIEFCANIIKNSKD